LYLFSKLQMDIIYKSHGYIVTRKGDNIQILLYHYKEACDHIFHGNLDEKLNHKRFHHLIQQNKEYILRIYNLEDDYTVKRYQLTQTGGNVLDHWCNIGSPKWLSNENKDLIQKSSFPKVTFSKIQQQNVYELHVSLGPFNVELITLEKKIMG
ncbi:MAG: hypothetical protein MJA31_15345, partial [Clostridia bacterium]|nr:hypothetical protein [Clostridia bacterium]